MLPDAGRLRRLLLGEPRASVRTLLAILAGASVFDPASPARAAGQSPAEVWVSDATSPALRGLSLGEDLWSDATVWESDAMTSRAQFQQPLVPSVEAPTMAPPSAAAGRASQQFWTSFGGGRAPPSFIAEQPAAASYATGQESVLRASTDMGDLLGGSPMVLNLGVQRRNPIVTDPRVRGSRVGSLAAAGSYWVPARLDLDTMTSKIDSRIVDHASVIPGPYSALYGPGLEFIDFELQRAPRYRQGFELYGSSSVDYHTNGEQWYGRQSLWGGDDVWGFRVGYGHRTGSDYRSGDGDQIPSSYKSRDIDLALGAQLTEDASINGQALRLDQTDVELAGQAFDIDWLVTDGYQIAYELNAPAWADRVVLDSWYNRTRFEGGADRPSKRAQFPFYEIIGFQGTTDVDSMSAGYRLLSSWDGVNGERLQAGPDLRYVKQELNEITSGDNVFAWIDQNSPIPRSYWSNPGLLIQYDSGVGEGIRFGAGGRIDYLRTHVIDDPAKLASVGVESDFVPESAADIWGSDDLAQNDLLGLGFASLDAELADGWNAGANVGYAERPPNLTERYAIETFMFLIQNGLNTVTGDPELDKERLIQTDLRLARSTDRFRGEVVAFHGWVRDYVTFEALEAVPFGDEIQQLSLKYVNTDLATLWGWEARAEYDWSDQLTPFATLKYVEGDDRTRNGTFDTAPATGGAPSTRTPGAPRGTTSGTGVAPVDREPLPGILPLEARLGLRWEQRRSAPGWGVETYARIVDNQDRVAASLLESPTPGFTVWDLRTFYRASERLLFVGGVENLTDKQFREHLDFRGPSGISVFRSGVNFYLGAEATY